MFEYLLGNKGEDLKALLTSSLKLFGEGEVRAPSIRRLWLAVFNRLFILAAFAFIFYGWHRGLGILMIVVGIFVLFPFSFFYNVKMKACQTWLAYAAITGRPRTLHKANEAAGNVKWSVRMFALAEFLIATGSAEGLSGNSGIMAQLARMLLSALEAVFDVVEDYLLPAIVIEQKAISEVGGRLADLKKNVPAALTGAFGLDLFGNAISSLTWFLHFALFALSVAAGWGLADVVPGSLVTTFPSTTVRIFLLPVFVAIVFSSLVSRTLKIFVSSLKDVYFAVFYTSINRPLEIRQDLRDTVTNYLNVKDVSYSLQPPPPPPPTHFLPVDLLPPGR
jgi:hypothetical protein